MDVESPSETKQEKKPEIVYSKDHIRLYYESILKYREFSFTVDERYMRYKSYDSGAELKEDLKRLMPEKIDIGAIFSGQMLYGCQDLSEMLAPNDSRSQDDFGFKNRLWVFSGRRGIHCWACDSKARSIDNEHRTVAADYLQVVSGGAEMKKKVDILSAKGKVNSFMPPSFYHIYEEFLKPKFVEIILENQGFAEDETAWKELVDLIGFNDADLPDLYAIINERGDAKRKWDRLVGAAEQRPKTKNGVIEVVFQYLYPELDANVSKQMNHLLKAPFSVHPKTGFVCVPFDPNADSPFDPFTQKPLVHILEQFDRAPKEDPIRYTDMYAGILALRDFAERVQGK